MSARLIAVRNLELRREESQAAPSYVVQVDRVKAQLQSLTVDRSQHQNPELRNCVALDALAMVCRNALAVIENLQTRQREAYRRLNLAYGLDRQRLTQQRYTELVELLRPRDTATVYPDRLK